MCQPIRLFIAECACYSLVFYTNHCDFECGAIVDWMCYLIHSTRTITTANQKLSHPMRQICKHHSSVCERHNELSNALMSVHCSSVSFQFSSFFYDVCFVALSISLIKPIYMSFDIHPLPYAVYLHRLLVVRLLRQGKSCGKEKLN